MSKHSGSVVWLLLISLTTGCATAIDEPGEIFEGEIRYRIDLESRHPKLSAPYLESQYGTTYTMVFKNGDYKEVHEGGRVGTVWYRSEENREYTRMAGEDFLRVYEGREILPTPTDVESLARTREILGYRAGGIVVRFDDDSQTTFWYSPALAVNPQWFEDFGLAGFHLYYPRAKSIILEYDRETSVLRRKYVATAVVRRSVDPAELALPELPQRPFDYEPED